MKIITEEEYNFLLQVAADLLELQSLTDEQSATLDTVVDAIEAYKDIHYPMEEVSDIDMLLHILEAQLY
jgi:hypothetical protein